MDSVRDAACVTRTLAGDSEAFGELYEAHADALFRFLLVRGLAAELAPDLVQESFVKALSSLHTLREPGRFRPWLLRIANNLLINRYAKADRRPLETSLDGGAEPSGAPTVSSESSSLVSDEPVPDESSEEMDRALHLEALLKADLLPRERTLLALRFGADLSLREVAAHLGCSPSAARQLQYRALQRLRQHLSGLDLDQTGLGGGA